MKIVIIHGQNHEGSTCMVARELAKKVGGEVQEFFLPRDFDKPCRGCYTCFQKDLCKCPHYKELEPLEKAILAADLLILDSPVYISHMSFGALSKEIKVALAKGSAMAKTAMCSGEGGILPEEKQAAYKYIFEYIPNKYSLAYHLLNVGFKSFGDIFNIIYFNLGTYNAFKIVRNIRILFI